MYATQASYRELYGLLLDYDGLGAFEAVLLPWIDEHEGERRFLESFAARPGNPWPAADDEELCRLYAASRVNELLLLRFQAPTNRASEWEGPPLTTDEYVRFMTSLGFRVEHHTNFEPFFHEVVSVESSADFDEPVQILTEHWPALMLGELLFSRAGCSVRAPARELDPRLATSSTLHWAHRRRNRPVQDLSMGWGGNSQWRTRFRRDYRAGGSLHFNVDGKIDAAEADESNRPNPAREDLTPVERIELLTNRCFVRTHRRDDDLWPWGDRHSRAETAAR
jgi:hypothetical protein